DENTLTPLQIKLDELGKTLGYIAMGICALIFIVGILQKRPILEMFMTVMLANLAGGVLPVLAKKLKLDPAIMAAPLISTLVDAMSLLIFFTIAVNLLKL
ncbi:MAG: magnesium transporter, partial [Lachnoanaerobaculum gingivalis]